MKGHVSFLSAHHVQPVSISFDGAASRAWDGNGLTEDNLAEPEKVSSKGYIELRRQLTSSTSNSSGEHPRLYHRPHSNPVLTPRASILTTPSASSNSSPRTPRHSSSGNRRSEAAAPDEATSSGKRSTHRRTKERPLRRSPSKHRSSSRQRRSSKSTEGTTSSTATSTTRASSTQSLQGEGSHGYFVSGAADGEAGIVAEKVRSLPDPLEIAWKDLRGEFEVQARIWESLAMMRKGKEMCGVATETDPVLIELQRQIEMIFEEVADGDYMEPIEDLEGLLQNAQDQEEGFTQAFEDAVHKVLHADVVSSKRHQLIYHLLSDLDEVDLNVTELGTLLHECEFTDNKLEYRIRQVLRLGLRGALRHNPETQSLVKRRVRFDLGPDTCHTYDDTSKHWTSRVSDGVFVTSEGMVSL